MSINPASNTSATTAEQQAVERWAAERGVSPATLRRAGVAASVRSDWPGDNGFETDVAAAFPYVRDGQAVGWKYRRIGRKQHSQQAGGEAWWFGLERLVRPDAERIYVVEGEPDALAMAEAGLDVAAWTGGAHAGDADADVETAAKFEPARVVREGAFAGKEIVLAGDMDDQGKALKSAFARLFGLAKVRELEWPEGLKDANDYLLTFGAEGLRRYAEERHRPWRIEGLYSIDELPERPPRTVWRNVLNGFDDGVALGGNCCSVLTGEPGSGKTHISAQIAFNVAKAYGVKIAVATFETLAKPQYQRFLRSFHSGRLQKEMTVAEIEAADEFIRAQYLFIQHPREITSFQWIIGIMEAAVNKGCGMIVIDPWNRLEHAREYGESETEYTGRALNVLMDFVRDFQVHVMVLTHPTKRPNAYDMKTQKRYAPQLSDISGSKHWENRVDQGFVIHRERKHDGRERITDSEFIIAKSRDAEELGFERSVPLTLDLDCGRFRVRPDVEGAVNPLPRANDA